MKILHLWGTAGVGPMHCHELKKRGYKAHCIMRKAFDPFDISTYYKADVRDISGPQWENLALTMAKTLQPDIIHYHSGFTLNPRLRLRAPKAMLINHMHGTRLATTDKATLEKFFKFSDKVLVSTPDLLPYWPDAEYLPNPIDVELFKPIDCEKDSLPVTISSRYVLTDLIDYPEFQIINRETHGVPYEKMNELLNKYATLIDIKPYKHRLKPVAEFSCTGLQALAAGLTVITADGKKHNGLPEKHRIENVVDRLLEIYKK